MTEEELWVRFAATALMAPRAHAYATADLAVWASKVADRLLDEHAKRYGAKEGSAKR